MTAPDREAVPTGQVLFNLSINGPGLEENIDITLNTPQQTSPEVHWALSDLLWNAVKNFADQLGVFSQTTSVKATRRFVYRVPDSSDPTDTYIAE